MKYSNYMLAPAQRSESSIAVVGLNFLPMMSHQQLIDKSSVKETEHEQTWNSDIS